MIYGAKALYGEEALAVGVVEQAGECLVLGGSSSGEPRPVIIWQFGTKWDERANVVVLPDGTPVASGSTISAGGGFHGSDSLDPFVSDPQAIEQIARCVEHNSSGSVFVIQHPVESAPSSMSSTVGATCEPVERLQVDEQGCVEVLDGAVYLGDELFIADPPIVPYPGREWRRADFPSTWNVTILNDAPTDGEDWIIHDVIARRLDDDTLRITDVDQRFIADLSRDPTPIDDRIVAG
ncbi:MAG: hypothetical protein CL424_14140 [Acidimicrobiaceae bacterium]|nr:hypothetical protein [Acidimicrobiaceae bacterium]